MPGGTLSRMSAKLPLKPRTGSPAARGEAGPPGGRGCGLTTPSVWWGLWEQIYTRLATVPPNSTLACRALEGSIRCLTKRKKAKQSITAPLLDPLPKREAYPVQATFRNKSTAAWIIFLLKIRATVKARGLGIHLLLCSGLDTSSVWQGHLLQGNTAWVFCLCF